MSATPDSQWAVHLIAAHSNSLPNKLPETPMNQEIGNLIDRSAALTAPLASLPGAAENQQAPDVTTISAAQSPSAVAGHRPGISCHEAENSLRSLRRRIDFGARNAFPCLGRPVLGAKCLSMVPLVQAVRVKMQVGIILA